MAWPSSAVRTKDWGSEILTDTDLEAQFDVLHTYINAFLAGTTGHDHSGADGYGKKIVLTTSVSGILPTANGGTALSTGFLNGNPIASIIAWPLASAPTDYLVCNGAAVSRTTYANLFAVISTTFGAGDGSTTFNLPNLVGKVPVGYDSTDTAFDTIGETGGAKTVDLSHDHGGVTGGVAFGSGTGSLTAGALDTTHNHTISSGLSTTQSVLQPYITLNYCIRYQ